MRSPSPTDRATEQGGFVMLLLLAVLVLPLLLLAIGTLPTSNLGGLAQQAANYDTARARSAAEAGVEDAIFQAQSSATLDGGVTVSRDLGDGRSFTFVTVLEVSDGQDNNGDTQIDEAAEDLLGVNCTGTYGTTTVTLYMALAPTGDGLPQLASSVTMLSTSSQFSLTDLGAVTGNNYDISGSPGSSSYDRYGMVIVAPGTTGDLNWMVTSGKSRITGVGSAPSFDVTTTRVDFPTIATAVQAAATQTLTGASYNGLSFGSGSSSNYQVTYRDGDLTLGASSQGAGILFVTGNFAATDSFRFDGVIYVGGNVTIGDSSRIYGALVMGPAGGNGLFKDNAWIRYSETAVTTSQALVGSGTKHYALFSGWSDLTR